MKRAKSTPGAVRTIRGSAAARAAGTVAALALRLLIVLGMLMLTPGAYQSVLAYAQPANSDYDGAMARLSTVAKVIEGLRDEIDRSRFDASALAFDLAFEDGATIIEWVGENIAYQPYSGLLRGADGTLMSGAGNSLDQSVLLATLLADAGYEVRIARGELDPEQAQQLLITASAPQLVGDSEALLERSADELSTLDDLPGVDGEAFRESLALLLQAPELDEELYGEAESTSEELLALLRADGTELAGGELHDRLLTEASEYAWVEYRISAADDWAAAHPLLPEPDQAPEPDSYLEATVPDELQHRLRVEVMIERKLGDDLEVLPVMDTWERPLANLSGVVLTYGNTPSALKPGREDDIATVLDESEFFIPQWNGSMAPGAQAFDVEGILLSPAVAQDQAAGVFRQVNENFQSAVGALGAIGDSSGGGDPQALTSQWIEHTLIAPGGEEQSYRRVLFDRIGEAQRRAGGIEPNAMTDEEVELALLTEQRIMAIPGGPRPEYLLDQFLARFLEGLPFLEYTIARLHGVTPSQTLEQAIASASPLEHLLSAQLFDAAAPRGEESLSYRAEPSVIVFSDGLKESREDAVGYTSLDIVHNARRMLLRDGEQFVANVSGAITQGVWETIVEREVLAGEGAGWNATTAIADAVASGAELMVLRPEADLAALELEPVAASNLQRDLDRGFSVVMPRSFPRGTRAAWWRLRPETGETLGITADGRGQTLTEYTIQLYDMGFSVMFAVKSLNDCEKSSGGDSLAHACCLVKAHVNNVAGLGMGSLLSKGFAGAVVGRVGKNTANVAGGLAGLSFGLTGGVLGSDITGMQC